MLVNIFLIMMLLGCSVFIFLGAWLVKIINDKVKRCTLKITGQIVDYEREKRIDTRSKRSRIYYVYKPKVKCYLAGLEVIKTLNVGECSSDSEYPSEICRFGEEVEILFNPSDYDDYYTLGEKTIKPIGIALICIGVFAVLFVSIFSAIFLLFV